MNSMSAPPTPGMAGAEFITIADVDVGVRAYSAEVTLPASRLGVRAVLESAGLGALRNWAAGLQSEVTRLHARVNALLDANNRELERRRAIHRAGLALYEAGRWQLAAPGANEADQAKLWEALRDALGLQPGTATALEAAAPPPPALFHDFIRTGDVDAHPAIQDRNGEVVLKECRVCRQAEGDLAATCPGAAAHRVAEEEAAAA